MKFILPVMLLLFMFMPGLAQQVPAMGEKIKTLTLSDTILYAAIDRPGDFYVITVTGQIQRYDKDGRLMLLYKAERAPTLFDPRDGARLFAYYRHDQHYEFLTPSFRATASYQIDPAFAIHPWLICPSGEYKLWVLDKADQSLKKIDVKASAVEVEVVVDSALIENTEAFKTMREYQSFVFLLNPAKGIFIFNSLGRHIKTIGTPGIRTFNFLGEELYFLRNGTLEFFNLFTAESRQMKIDTGFTDALLTDERIILFAPERIDIFAFRP